MTTLTPGSVPAPDPWPPTPSYVELRCRSAFSFLAGASQPEDLIARAAELDYPVLALGDRDGLYGAPRFHHAAQRAGVRALIGTLLTFGERGQRSRVGGREGASVTNPRLPAPDPGNQLYLLVSSRTGYRNLCRLLTQTKLRSPKGESFATWDDLEGHTEGLICLTRLQGVTGLGGYGVRGGSGSPSLRRRGLGGGSNNPSTPNPQHRNLLSRLKALFPGNLYLEIQRHLDPAEERWNRKLMAVAEHFDVPIVATNDVRHATAAGRPLLDVLTCLHEKTVLDDAGRRLLSNAERHLKPAREMVELFRDRPDAVANTLRIAEQCEFTLANLGYRFPEYPVPSGENANGYLRQLSYAGARERYGTITPRIRRQLEHELRIIAQLDLAGYFLIVWDIVQFCRRERMLAQGRGSAANSAVCYSLGITAVDAVGMDLLFERFLSTERGEWPDIDIDLPSGDQREKVIQYVYQRYGERGAGMTANVITYRTRSAVREVGKVLGFGTEQVDRLSKLLRRFEFRDDLDDLAKQLKDGGVDASAPRVKMLVDLVGQIQNLPRHLGQHSGGMVIAAGRLDEIVPLEPARMEGRVVVQWDKDDCAGLGIIKVDLLGLGMLAVLEETIPLVREHEGVEIDLARLPQDDPQTYAMLQKADTVGVFQVESRAQMATLPRMKPEHFYDLVVEVAIIRPGPIVGQMVHPYLNRRNGREPVTYAHPDLEPILKRTLGVPLFQEQLLRIAMTLGGFSGGEAEELRRAMGFKRSIERMREIEKRLRHGMAERGITGKAADDIIRSITSFALYGFPESHAASFALIAYASAYLRAHHLAAFTCAMLNNWPLGFYHPATLVKDAQRHGVRVLPVDVTRSNVRCTLEQGGMGLGGYGVRGGSGGGALASNPQPRNPLSLRLGLRWVAGLREEAGKRIEAARAEMPFESVTDVAGRADLHEDEVQTLAYVGAFASLGMTRREALWQAAAVPRGALFKGVMGLGGYGVRGKDRNVKLTSSIWQGSETSPPQQDRSDAHQSTVRGQTPKPANPIPLPWSPPNPLTPQPPNPLVLPPSKKPGVLPEMSAIERTLADYKGTGLTIGPHLMRHLREELNEEGVVRACDLPRAKDGRWVKVAGLVIVRQRPGTAKGFCFLTLEDETGICNAVVVPDMFQKHRALIHTAALLLVEGPLQIVDDVIHVRARRFRELRIPDQSIDQKGSGYRMRVSPRDRPDDEHPNNEPPVTLPKSHDFR